MTKLEGEDEVLQAWQDGHRYFFELEGKELNFSSTEEARSV